MEGNEENEDADAVVVVVFAASPWLWVWLVCRLSGGRPRILPEPPGPPLLHAEETTFAPWRRFVFAFVGVTLGFGSPDCSGQ